MKISLADLIIQNMILFDKPAHYIQFIKNTIEMLYHVSKKMIQMLYFMGLKMILMFGLNLLAG